VTSVAVVGTGSIGRRHLSNLRQLGVTDVLAVSEHSRRTELRVDDVDVPVVLRYDDVLDSTIDAIVIGNPSSLHLDYLRRAVEAGKDVLCEKPVATSAGGIAEVIAAARARDVIVGVGHQFRFNAQLERFRSRLDAGEVGTVIDVQANLGEHIADYHPDEDYRSSYAARADLGGGVLLTQIHLFDLLNWIFGPFEMVFGTGGQRTELDIDVEDCVSFMLVSAAGLPVHGHLDYVQRPKRMTVNAIGQSGAIEWDYHANRLTYTAPATGAVPEHDDRPFERNEMFLELMRDFLDAVDERRPPRSTIHDALASLQIVDALRASCRDGGAVQLAKNEESS
jgi:predicted dehydrogenase